MVLSQNDIKTYSLMTYLIQDMWLKHIGMSLCHYVLALSSYVQGISMITPLPFGGGRGEGEGPVGGSGLVAHSFFFISCAYNNSINILSFLIFFI